MKRYERYTNVKLLYVCMLRLHKLINISQNNSLFTISPPIPRYKFGIAWESMLPITQLTQPSTEHARRRLVSDPSRFDLLRPMHRVIFRSSAPFFPRCAASRRAARETSIDRRIKSLSPVGATRAFPFLCLSRSCASSLRAADAGASRRDGMCRAPFNRRTWAHLERGSTNSMAITFVLPPRRYRLFGAFVEARRASQVKIEFWHF